MRTRRVFTTSEEIRSAVIEEASKIGLSFNGYVNICVKNYVFAHELFPVTIADTWRSFVGKEHRTTISFHYVVNMGLIEEAARLEVSCNHLVNLILEDALTQ